jgi:hypothetical protein
VKGNQYVAGIAVGSDTSITLSNVYNAGTITSTTSGKGASIYYMVGTAENTYNNLYSLSGCAAATMASDWDAWTNKISDKTTEVSDMKSSSFVSTLNSNRGDNAEWTSDASNSNKGYPVFK